MNILRVFPYRTSYTPDDEMVLIGGPGLFIPPHDEVHISCVFTWDMDACEALKYQWKGATDKPVRLGGPAYDRAPAQPHTPGLYTKPSVAFASRGCNNNCPWCLVSKREGPLMEMEIKPGNIIQDNNFLQCSRRHQQKAFDMLRSQRQICFKGGLECGLIDDRFVDAATSLRIAELWLACDTDGALPGFKRACAMLSKAGFSREKIRCYALIGDDMEKNEARLREVWHFGAMPFAQLYQPPGRERKEYDARWKAFARQWQRPAAMRMHMEHGTSFEMAEIERERAWAE